MLANITLSLSDYLKDPYSDKNPCNTICCRGDLETIVPRADGCYDTKVSGMLTWSELRFFKHFNYVL